MVVKWLCVVVWVLLGGGGDVADAVGVVGLLLKGEGVVGGAGAGGGGRGGG